MLCSEVQDILNQLAFNHSAIAQGQIDYSVWMTGLAHHHKPIRVFICVILDNMGLCQAQQLQGEYSCLLGIDGFTEVNAESLRSM